MEYATQHNITQQAPSLSNKRNCGRFLRLPSDNSALGFEGGLRLQGWYKQSFPETPLISVVMTVFNNCGMVERAICSVLSQTYSNIELIVVDAASKDNILFVMQKYADAIDYYVSRPDSGMYEGVNDGIHLATGDFVLILNSDDWYFPEAVSKLVQHALVHECDGVWALSCEADAHGVITRKIPKMPFKHNTLLRMPLRHELMLISRNVYDSLGVYDSDYKIIADLKFTQQVFKSEFSTCDLDEYLMAFRKVGMASSLTDAFIKERERLIAENFPDLQKQDIHILAKDNHRENLHELTKICKKYNDDDLRKAIKDLLTMCNLWQPFEKLYAS